MAEKNEKSVWIDIDDIKIDEMQSRLGHWSNDKKDDALVDSMKGIGQIQDVIVRPLSSKNGEKFKYGLVAGSNPSYFLLTHHKHIFIGSHKFFIKTHPHPQLILYFF